MAFRSLLRRVTQSPQLRSRLGRFSSRKFSTTTVATHGFAGGNVRQQTIAKLNSTASRMGKFKAGLSTTARQCSKAALVTTAGYAVYSVLSDDAHRRRVISENPVGGSGPATQSIMRGFFRGNLETDVFHDEPTVEDGEHSVGEGAMERYLLAHGVSASDIPKLLSMVVMLKYIGYGLTMLISVRFRPIKKLFKLRGPRRLLTRVQTRYPETWATWEVSNISLSSFPFIHFEH